MEHEAVVESTSCPSPSSIQNPQSNSDNCNNDLVQSTNASSITSTTVRRRCWEEAFASESDSATPEPEDLQMENLEVDICSSTTADGNSKPSKEEAAIVCEAHPGCLKSFKSVREYEDHYNLRHRHKCITCSKSLPSAHILELHVLETHDTLFSLMAERKPMLACFLESCSSTFWKVEERKQHCLGEHGFPKSFKLWDLAANFSGSRQGKKSDSKQQISEKKTNKQKSKSKNLASLKDKMETEEITTNHVSNDVSSSSNIPNGSTAMPRKNETMEMDRSMPEKMTEQAKPSSSKPKKGSSIKSKNHEKSVPNQITFGHSASRTFKPKYAFGLPKAKPQPEEPCCSTSSKMDLSDIRDVLPTTTSSLNQVPSQVP